MGSQEATSVADPVIDDIWNALYDLEDGLNKALRALGLPEIKLPKPPPSV